MSLESNPLKLYRELADRYDQCGQFSMRDRFLMLAADTAYESGQPQEAEELRQRLLRLNRHHMLRPYSSFEEALAAADVQTYLADLRANYPPDIAAQLLKSLKGGPKSVPVEQTQPLDWMPPVGPAAPAAAPAPVPPTAPVVDPYKPSAIPSKPAWQPAVPIRLLEDEPPAQAPTAKPMAQPLPGRKNPPPTLLEPPSSPAPRPTAALPVAAPVPPPAAPTRRPAPAPGAPAPRPKPAPAPARRAPVAPPAPGAAAENRWLAVILATISVLAAAALAAFTLGRPFLPAGWLP